MTKALRPWTLLIVACLLSWAPALAQQSTTRGLVVGLDLGGTAISFENEAGDGGSNGGIRVGYGFNRILTFYLGIYGGALDVQEFDEFDEVTVGHLDVGVRLHLANSRRRWVPYGDLALTPRVVQADVTPGAEENTIDFSGGAFTLGGGIAFYLSEAWALDFNVKWSTGEFTDVTIGGVTFGGRDLDSQSSRVTIGVSWWP